MKILTEIDQVADSNDMADANSAVLVEQNLKEEVQNIENRMIELINQRSCDDSIKSILNELRPKNAIMKDINSVTTNEQLTIPPNNAIYPNLSDLTDSYKFLADDPFDSYLDDDVSSWLDVNLNPRSLSPKLSLQKSSPKKKHNAPLPPSSSDKEKQFNFLAMFDYDSELSTDLSFKRNDVITASSTDNPQGFKQDWLVGRLNDRLGLFPVCYTQRSDEVMQDETTGSETYRALYDFNSDVTGDLSFSKGQLINVTKRIGSWWTGSIGLRQGHFPYNYVEPVNSSQN
ncbi:hypothetical protein ACOME3_009785 [Neoechinorhynchus agilis]